MTAPALRLDKWLWHARLFRTRRLATRYVETGRLRVDGEKTAKPHFSIRGGEVLTFPLGKHIRVIRILRLSDGRAPAGEARSLYEDIVPVDEARETDLK